MGVSSHPDFGAGADVDRETLAAYDAAAASYAADWHEQPPPADMHAIIRRFFKQGVTADIGCGSGRDVAWLAANGYPAEGYDASAGLLAAAKARYPDLQFHQASLPELAGIADESFDNVLCETVIMHLAHDQIRRSARRLMDILKPGGILYLSWRVTESADQRDANGRLYAAFEPELVAPALTGAVRLLDEEVISASSGKKIHRIVARKAVRT
jgi:SAM-dependent methyltransferase